MYGGDLVIELLDRAVNIGAAVAEGPVLVTRPMWPGQSQGRPRGWLAEIGRDWPRLAEIGRDWPELVEALGRSLGRNLALIWR